MYGVTNARTKLNSQLLAVVMDRDLDRVSKGKISPVTAQAHLRWLAIGYL